MAHSLGKLQNEFLDWLCLDYPYKNLRIESNQSREQIAAIMQISPHSIRRYETENKAPYWYYLLLRMLCGDLSIYGARWVDCRIQPHDRKLKAPELKQPLYPVELNAMYNRAAQIAKRDADQERTRANRAESELEAVKKLNTELLARIDLLEQETARLKGLKQGIERGKVVNLFKN